MVLHLCLQLVPNTPFCGLISAIGIECKDVQLLQYRRFKPHADPNHPHLVFISRRSTPFGGIFFKNFYLYISWRFTLLYTVCSVLRFNLSRTILLYAEYTVFKHK